MVETTEETAYQIAVTNLTTAIDSANLPVTEKDHLTNVLQRMDTEAGSVAEFANATIEILGYARDNAPELFRWFWKRLHVLQAITRFIGKEKPRAGRQTHTGQTPNHRQG